MEQKLLKQISSMHITENLIKQIVPLSFVIRTKEAANEDNRIGQRKSRPYVCTIAQRQCVVIGYVICVVKIEAIHFRCC